MIERPRASGGFRCYGNWGKNMPDPIGRYFGANPVVISYSEMVPDWTKC
jgi:hypothetical protein